MPYRIEQRGDRYCVIREADQSRTAKTVFCHDTEQDARNHIQALYANVEDARKDS